MWDLLQKIIVDLHSYHFIIESNFFLSKITSVIHLSKSHIYGQTYHRIKILMFPIHKEMEKKKNRLDKIWINWIKKIIGLLGQTPLRDSSFLKSLTVSANSPFLGLLLLLIFPVNYPMIRRLAPNNNWTSDPFMFILFYGLKINLHTNKIVVLVFIFQRVDDMVKIISCNLLKLWREVCIQNNKKSLDRWIKIWNLK